MAELPKAATIRQAVSPAGPTHAVDVELKVPDVAMTDEHYDRIKGRIRREIKGTLATSLWVALALAAVTLGISLIVTVQSASLSEGTQGEMELGYWVCFGFAAFCCYVHCVYTKDADQRAEDVINEIETHLFRVPHGATQSPPMRVVDAARTSAEIPL